MTAVVDDYDDDNDDDENRNLLLVEKVREKCYVSQQFHDDKCALQYHDSS